jgi:hypothetical protein
MPRGGQGEPGPGSGIFGHRLETTTPAVAATLEEAREQGLANFSVFSLHKLVPPALEIIFLTGNPGRRADLPWPCNRSNRVKAL